MDYLRQSWLVLGLAIGLGSSLAAIDRSLRPRIAENAEARLKAAVLEIVPNSRQVSKRESSSHSVYQLFDGKNEPVGWAVPAATMGFVDKIRLIVGVSADGTTITGLAVLESRETPGLGDNIQQQDFRAQFEGKSATKALAVVKPGQVADNSIDALTGATISTRAVATAVNEALNQVRGGFRQDPPEKQKKGMTDG